jgi:hypothetical protein
MAISSGTAMRVYITVLLMSLLMLLYTCPCWHGGGSRFAYPRVLVYSCVVLHDGTAPTAVDCRLSVIASV